MVGEGAQQKTGKRISVWKEGNEQILSLRGPQGLLVTLLVPAVSRVFPYL